MPAGTYSVRLQADVDIDQVSGTKNSNVQMYVERVGSTNIVFTEVMVDDDHQAQSPMPAGACSDTDHCVTTHIDNSGTTTFGAKSNSDYFVRYRLLVYRQRTDVMVRLRNVSVTMKRLAD